jgi:hypothetical protein
MITEELKTFRHPNFIIAGAPKAGTTSLYRYLAQHPQIFLPNAKEPMFFCGYERNFVGPTSDWYNTHMVNEPQDYLALFADAAENVLSGEASTDYLSCPKAAARIKAWNPDAKIIIILRNPIDRAYSEHMSLVKKMCEDVSFLKSIELEEQRITKGYTPYFWHVKRGLYYEAIKRYFDCFDRKNILIFLYSELNQAAKQVVESIFSFLDVENISIDTTERFNVSGRPKSKFLQRLFLSKRKRYFSGIARTFIRNDEVRGKLRRSIMLSNLDKPQLKNHEFVYLRDIFYEDIMKLQELLQIDLSDWVADRHFN